MATLLLEFSDTTRADMLAEVLRDHGHRLAISRLHDGDDVPARLEGIDGIGILGGPQSSNDSSQDWLQPLLDLLVSAHEADIPLLGICLGNQLLARALGGTVEIRSAGTAFGWGMVELTAHGREDPLFAGLPWNCCQMRYHSEEVTELPPGARLLASADEGAVQAWVAGVRTYGIQYHVEAYPSTIERWIANDPDLLQRTGFSREQFNASMEECHPGAERRSRRFFESVALLLMPIDRRSTGIPKDLQH